MIALSIARHAIVGAILADVALPCVFRVQLRSPDSEIFRAEAGTPVSVMEDSVMGLVRFEMELSVVEREEE